MRHSFLPSTDAGLRDWAANFAAWISEDPSSYGLTSGQATAFNTAFTTYSNAYTAAIEPSTRTKGTVAAKNTAKAALREIAGLLSSVIQGQSTVTNQQKIDLGLTVRDHEPSPIPPPAESPEIDVLGVVGRTVKIRLHGTTLGRRGRPVGTIGATIMSFVGAEPPVDPSAWKFEFMTGKTVVEVAFPDVLSPGTKVWITAFWFNPRKETGPAADPVSAYVQYGLMSEAA